MKGQRWLTFLGVLFLLTSCGGGLSHTPAPTPTLKPPPVDITPVPSVEATMRAFLEAFRAEDYPAMYAMLSQTSRAAISLEDFSKRYADALLAMNVREIDYTITSTLTNPLTAQAAFNLIYRTAILGDIERDNLLASFVLEEGAWHLQWSEALILPELAGGNTLQTEYRIPARGDIYDRQGNALATQSEAVALGLVPGEINPDQEGLLLNVLFQLTGLRPDTIRARYAYAQPDWYIPVGEISIDEYAAQRGTLAAFSGLVISPYEARYYQRGGIAPHAVGYTLYISKEEQAAYRRQGYQGSERVGYDGIERWGEPYLAGKHGATLYVVDPNGAVVTILARSDPQPAQSIYLTIDREFQQQVQEAFDGLPGAAVVIELNTGRVLAIVSSPGFDPNIFEPTNRNAATLYELLQQDPNQPLFNRATMGQYPLGSVFKIITMAAALESGLYKADSTYDCQYQFTELFDRTLYDWTWDHCQRELQTSGECKTQPSGVLTLPQGLMRSCNPWFWHIGLDLYRQGKGNLIPEMARAFGLGKATGIEIEEATGNVAEPESELAATNIAIGQDPILVTPLQVAVFTAALGNGGTLYRPQLVEKVQPVSGEPTHVFSPEIIGKLPVSPENLKIITDAMREVVENPKGTAHHRFIGLNIPVAGKTGTAESGIAGYPHAWFTGFTMKNDPNKPDIAVVVFVQNKGEGSDYAAPIFRRIVEIYFYGRPQSLYWFESNIGITETPTPPGWTPQP